MQNFNLHTHSNFSDGKCTPEEMVEEAVRQGLKAIGFSDHSPVPFPNKFAIRQEELENYISTIHALKEKYKGVIDIYCSMEMDFIPGIINDLGSIKKKYGFDYMIGSVHLVGNELDRLWFIDGSKYETYDEGLDNYFGGDIKRGVRAFFAQTNNLIENEDFEILGHFDKIKMHNRDRYFHEDEKWYQDLLSETLDLIRQRGKVVEINTRGIYKKRHNDFYPAQYLFKKMHDMGIPVIISSDAHHFSELTLGFAEAEKALAEAGYKMGEREIGHCGFHKIWL